MVIYLVSTRKFYVDQLKLKIRLVFATKKGFKTITKYNLLSGAKFSYS